MFDIAFSELVIIALVALIVIGPERLPKVARAAGIMLGRLQRYVSDVKADINREIQIEELKKMQEDVAAKMREMETSVSAQLRTVESDLNESIASGIEAKAEQAPALPAAEAAVAAAALGGAPEAAVVQPAAAPLSADKPPA